MRQTTNIKIRLQYDGSRYDGWQKQGNTEQTIQGKLEQITRKMAGEAVEIHGSGRTDAGVHARGQIANFHLWESFFKSEMNGNVANVVEYLNRYLPEDIRVLEGKVVSSRFHSRLSAAEKTYTYYIETGKNADVFQRKYVYHLGKVLNLPLMKVGADALCGTHDFKSFSSTKRMKKSTVRTLKEIKIETEGSRVIITFRGDGFLHHMVRILVGTLIEVGLGERKPETLPDLILEKDREKAGFTAPASGLFLTRVTYKE